MPRIGMAERAVRSRTEEGESMYTALLRTTSPKTLISAARYPDLLCGFAETVGGNCDSMTEAPPDPQGMAVDDMTTT